MKINNDTSVKTDIKTIGGVVIAVAISVYSYFTVIERTKEFRNVYVNRTFGYSNRIY